MAFTPRVFLGLFFLVLALSTVSGQSTPTRTKEHPQGSGQYDGTVLVPGLGRFMVPKKGQKPFSYNPITGAPTEGYGAYIPDIGGSTGMSAPHQYIPGGDDTLLPNSGVEVPIPNGGSVPTP